MAEEKSTTPKTTEEKKTTTSTPKTTEDKKTTSTASKTPEKTERIAPEERAKDGKVDDSATLKDTQQVAEQSRELLGNPVNPERLLYQTSQFDVSTQHPNILKHLAEPHKTALEAVEASDQILKGEHKDQKEQKGEGDN